MEFHHKEFKTAGISLFAMQEYRPENQYQAMVVTGLPGNGVN